MTRGKRRQVVIGGISLAVLLMMAGCSGSKKAESKNITIDVVSLADKIISEGSFKDEMNKIEQDQFDASYEGVERVLVKNQCAYVGTGATAEQVVVLEAKDSSDAEKLKEQLKEKLADDIEENKDYLPQEVKKLESPVLEVQGQYAIMVVSEDNKKAEDVIKKSINK